MPEEKKKASELYMEKELLLPYTHILKVQGKKLRDKIPVAFNHWFKLPKDTLDKIMDVMGMVYNGTLLIDDIQDNTSIRRGLPSAHCIYGIPLTVNTSLHVITLLLQKLQKLGNPEVITSVLKDFLEIIRGQGTELIWRENFICPTEEQYNQMNRQKTGYMFLMSVHMMQIFSENKTYFDDFVLNMGLYFQLRDDYCNLIKQVELEEYPDAAYSEKGINLDIFCEDLTEGKFTLPIIHAAQTSQGDAVLNILRQRTTDVALKKFCVSELERLGSLEYTRGKLIHLDKYIRDEIKRLGDNPGLTAAMDELLSWK
ncbi:unnamed protein product [Leptosia nina]|uniref:Geranylgeranyl pyrophosphate synthase n=1 Tax=Leptosia nina TaxID=320188 RepID=A0AAV1JBV7_9NEOP